jgi:hypothetical protein
MSISFDESYSVKNGFDREARCVAKVPKESGLDDVSSRIAGNKAQKAAAAETECCGFGLQRTIFKVLKLSKNKFNVLFEG